MQRVRRLLLVHTNDIHGRVEGLSRIATIIERVRAENPDAAVAYVDVGDVEETKNRLSNLTKGAALHRLLHVAGCRAVAVGNGSVLRYGHQVLVYLRSSAVPNARSRAGRYRYGGYPSPATKREPTATSQSPLRTRSSSRRSSATGC